MQVSLVSSTGAKVQQFMHIKKDTVWGVFYTAPDLFSFPSFSSNEAKRDEGDLNCYRTSVSHWLGPTVIYTWAGSGAHE